MYYGTYNLSYRTKKAMGGSVTFRESLRIRLNMIKPTRQQLQHFIDVQNIKDVLTPRVTYVKMLQLLVQILIYNLPL